MMLLLLSQKDKTEGGDSTAELTLSHVGGVFVVLIGGIILALLIAVCEFLWNIRKLAVVRHVRNRYRIFGLLQRFQNFR